MSALAFAHVDIPVKNLLAVANPFEHPPWHCNPFTIDEVWEAVDEGRLQTEPVPNWYSRQDQIERVAYFVEMGWVDTEQSKPHIDVGVPQLGAHVDWIICDGNHRFSAAVVRNDRIFKAVISGSLDYAEELLKIEIPSKDRYCED